MTTTSISEPNPAARSAEDILRSALDILLERGRIYGPAGVHYEDLAKLTGAYFYREPTARDMALENVLEKLDRLRRCDANDPAFKDSIIDAINYLAIAWEIA